MASQEISTSHNLKKHLRADLYNLQPEPERLQPELWSRSRRRAEGPRLRLPCRGRRLAALPPQPFWWEGGREWRKDARFRGGSAIYPVGIWSDLYLGLSFRF